MDGRFTVNDSRGEYWLYTEGALRVNIGRGAIGSACHFNTSDIHVESGGPIGSGKVAEILSRLMIQFGSKSGGYRELVLHLDGKFSLAQADIASINQALASLGFAEVRSAPVDQKYWRR